MKGLKGLIRLGRFELDQKRRQLKMFEEQRAAIAQMLQNLHSSVRTEQSIAGQNEEVGFAYANFASASIWKREELERRLVDAEKLVDAAKVELANAFQEVKRYEIVKANREAAAAKAEAMRVQAELDEVGLTGFRRREKDIAGNSDF